MKINTLKNKNGFATTLLVLGLSLLTLGLMIGYYQNVAIQHRDTMQHVRKQASQPLLEQEGRDVAIGCIKTIIEGMKGNVGDHTPPIAKNHHYLPEDHPNYVKYERGAGNVSYDSEGNARYHGTNNRNQAFKRAYSAHEDAFLDAQMKAIRDAGGTVTIIR